MLPVILRPRFSVPNANQATSLLLTVGVRCIQNAMLRLDEPRLLSVPNGGVYTYVPSQSGHPINAQTAARSRTIEH